jgi:hypothetical protein
VPPCPAELASLVHAVPCVFGWLPAGQRRQRLPSANRPGLHLMHVSPGFEFETGSLHGASTVMHGSDASSVELHGSPRSASEYTQFGPLPLSHV